VGSSRVRREAEQYSFREVSSGRKTKQPVSSALGKPRLARSRTSSYASSSDQRLHFRLGAAAAVDNVQIRWPDGATGEIKIPAVDRILTVVESKRDCGAVKLPPRRSAQRFRSQSRATWVSVICEGALGEEV
jgi:ASPIC and UnbV